MRGRNIIIKFICIGTAFNMVFCSSAFSDVVYKPELYPYNVLEALTLDMNSNERLLWYLDKIGTDADATISNLQSSVNPEIIGILNVGEEIDERVTQTTNNDYYLEHNSSGEEDVNGSAFVDSRCDFFPQDDQIIIHGHNMKGGAVFGALNNFRELEFLRGHALITLETLSGIDYYVLYAVTDVNVDTEADNYFQMIVWEFDPDSFFEYTDYLTSHSYFSIPVDLEYGDRLLTLSTCSYVYSDSRLVICARKLRDGEEPDDMALAVAKSTDSLVGLDDTAFIYNGGGDYESLTEDRESESSDVYLNQVTDSSGTQSADDFGVKVTEDSGAQGVDSSGLIVDMG